MKSTNSTNASAASGTRLSKRFLSGLLLLGILSCSQQAGAQAQDGRYIGSGAGSWSDTENWEDGIVADGIGANALLIGSSGSSITLDHPISLGSLKVEGFSSGSGWVLSGGTLTFASLGGEKPLIDLGNPTTPSGSSRLEISSIIAGNNGLNIIGSSLYLTGQANVFTGGIDLSGRLTVAGSGSLNGNTIRFTGDRSFLSTGTGNGHYNSNLVLAASDTTIVSRASASVVTFSGVISEEGGSRDLLLSQSGVGITTVRLTGDNTYTGNTTIGRASNDMWALVVRAENDHAFGRGDSTVSFAGGAGKQYSNDAIWLEGGIVVSGKKLILRGAGYQSNGSLRNRIGDNEWAGDVELGIADSPRVGVDAGTTLIISGKITGDAAGGLVKSGEGSLILAGDNSYTTGTHILAGRIVAKHQNALGGSSGTVSLEGGTLLEIAAGVSLEVDNLALSADSELSFNFSNAESSKLTVYGDQSGSDVYRVTLNLANETLAPGTYVLLNVQGEAAAAGFVLGEESPQPHEGYLNWNRATGTLTYTVIPESSVASLFGLGLLAGCIAFHRKRATKH